MMIIGISILALGALGTVLYIRYAVSHPLPRRVRVSGGGRAPSGETADEWFSRLANQTSQGWSVTTRVKKGAQGEWILESNMTEKDWNDLLLLTFPGVKVEWLP